VSGVKETCADGIVAESERIPGGGALRTTSDASSEAAANFYLNRPQLVEKS
jgi:hypothetical protein